MRYTHFLLKIKYFYEIFSYYFNWIHNIVKSKDEYILFYHLILYLLLSIVEIYKNELYLQDISKIFFCL